ncbi:ABC transporter substrate-binding protein [Anaeromicropila populeti]|uniref:Peptide/nickel transport system substrate-binding protein n=1 Tax=Anaeromicropila populeti TaxID=37658 RepID=A0A1I6IFV2_9FIRM|nr:ABC transporter substrate-binding protein [Anaeromicropila populeti]SFR65578.1 peptide/nickel transport system substrate-binding protein [Anaeromicropila populeti]
MKKRIFSLLLTAALTLGFVSGCSSSSDITSSTEETKNSSTEAVSTGETLNMATAFWYELDAHKDYNGWYSSMYGITETLFKVGDDYSTEPWIAETGTCEGNTWTIKLKDTVVFSNGNPVNSSVVIANLQRAGKMNERAALLAAASFEEVDETTFKITTQQPYPTLLSDLTDPFTSIMDIENIPEDDYNNSIIGTGPFKLESYSAEDKIVLTKNENYWNGDVILGTVNVYYIPDSSTESMSLQSGEIDVFVGPDTDSIALFEADNSFKVTSTASTKAYYYIFNMDTMTDDAVREAIMKSVNKSDIVTLLAGSIVAAEGAYGPDTALGAVSGPSYDPEGAKKILESAGYALNKDGFYEKDGTELTIRIAYFAARSIDKITTLIQDELKKSGINTELQLYEDPDATYMETGDFDMAMYVYSTTTSGDAYSFLNATLSATGNKNCGNYNSENVNALLNKLVTETDSSKRVDLSLQIQQQVLDDHAVGYYAMTNKVTVSKSTVSNCNETNPLTFYFLTKDTCIG